MAFDLLHPVNAEIVEFIAQGSPYALGNKVTLHKTNEFPVLENVKIALIGVLDNRGGTEGNNINLHHVRKSLYQLFPGNWNVNIVDLGDVLPGEKITDTHFLVKEIVAELVKRKIIPVILGGGQNLTYAMYRGYDKLEQMVNVVNVDSSFDIGNGESDHTDKSFVSKIIVNEPNNLFNYVNIGYQVYYNSQYEIDLMDQLYFDCYRLGDISADLSLAEPVFRDSDLVSFDMNAVKSSASGNTIPFTPNGFNGKEICALSRYAGISDKVSSFGLFNQRGGESESMLIAQIIWYFIEGVNYRSNEYPFGSRANYIKYNVLVDEMDLVFYKSDETERWWIEIPSFEKGNRLQPNTLLPCSYADYIKACENEVPERWWKAYRKNIL